MNKDPEKLDDQIDRFLQAEEAALKPRFSNANLAREIFSKNPADQRKNRLIPFFLVGLAACIVFAFLSQFLQSGNSSEAVNQGDQPQTAELLDSDKQLLEELLAMPYEMNWGEALPDESTFDLLVLLDQPIE
jgi:hypothetical protein